MKITWYMIPVRYEVHQIELFWDLRLFFCPFTSITAQKMKIKKKEKKPWDIIILNKCTKNHDDRLYCFWDMAHERCNCYFSFWAILFPFNPITAQNQKKRKITLEISSLYTGATKIMIMSSNVPEIWHVMDVTVVNAIFCPFYHPTLTAQKMKSSKKWKKCLKISSFYTSVTKIMTICYAVPEIWCVTDVIIFHFSLFFALLPL